MPAGAGPRPCNYQTGAEKPSHRGGIDPSVCAAAADTGPTGLTLTPVGGTAPRERRPNTRRVDNGRHPLTAQGIDT